MPKPKNRPTWNIKKMYEPVRLSQCMIVKNEERNIESALKWAKGIAIEQIVVDTGSTDRTVEIAQSMGAKVFHFKWIHDFAAAKNFAIEKAKGNWIAFLDADEYYSEEGAKAMFEVLKWLQSEDPEKKADFVRSSWAHLGDDGKPFMINIQDRVFRNTPEIRYHGNIHEQIRREDRPIISYDASKELTIFHTGYMQKAFRETNKANRNVELLRMAIEDRPNDIDLVGYLGESLFVSAEYEEAEKCLRKLIAAGGLASEQRRKHAYDYLGRILGIRKASADELISHYEQAIDVYPKHYDFLFGLANALKQKGLYFRAMQYYDRCEGILKTASSADESYSITRPAGMYANALNTAIALLDNQKAVEYATLLLKQEKFAKNGLLLYLKCFYPDAQSPDEADPSVNASVFNILKQLYDFSELKDKLFILKNVKLIENSGLEKMLMEAFTQEEMEWLNQKESELPDLVFDSSMLEVARSSESAIALALAARFANLSSGDKQAMIAGVAQFGYWGQLDPDNAICSAFENCANALKKRHTDFVRLYRRLEDVRSKNVLTAILMNWLMFDFRRLMLVRDKNYPDYFDQELFYCGKDEVFIDAGAYNGDTAYSYIKTYGQYSKIYCYEPTPELYKELCGYMSKYEGMELRSAAVGEKSESRFLLRDGSDGALNRIVTEPTDTPVTIVSLDEDIQEPVTFIKMDVEGMEKEALEGARRHITEEKPKLAISAYHSYTDLLDIAHMMLDMNPDYKLYLRYYGGNLLTTEFVLLAINGTPEALDWRFNELKNRIEDATYETLMGYIKRGYKKLNDDELEKLEACVSKHTLWGAVSKESDDYTAFENRASFFSKHHGDIEWFYDALSDTRSKNTLFAVLSNWLDIDMKLLSDVRDDNQLPYFDIELISPGGDDVFVDLGINGNESIIDFLCTYGSYKTIFRYSYNEEDDKALCRRLDGFSNIEFRQKDGTPKSATEIMLSAIDPAESPAIESGGDNAEQRIINLDEDIAEPITLIRMDLPGETEATLLSAARHIREEKPRLAIALHNSYDDMIKIPRLVLELNPEYDLYLRYYGKDSMPENIVLYAV